MRGLLLDPNTGCVYHWRMMAGLSLSVIASDPGEAMEATNELLRMSRQSAPDCKFSRPAAGESVPGAMGVEVATATLLVQLLAAPAVIQLVFCLKDLIRRKSVVYEVTDGVGGSLKVSSHNIEDTALYEALSKMKLSASRDPNG